VAFAATATGQGTLSYAWDFGDGGTATGATATHTYLRAGVYTPALTITDETGDSVSQNAQEITVTVPPPVATTMTKAGNPFRLTFGGVNFQSGVQVTIGSDAQPWGQVSWKSNTKVVLKGGSALKAVVPKGQATTFTFVNPDGGRSTFTAVW
jgi:PKD repeat protein